MSEASHQSSVHSCTECRAALAHDQRYCVTCGARRGALPIGVAGTIAGILERGRPAPAPRGPAAGPDPGPTPAARTGWTPTPRATAVAVLSMLGFGVIVGSTVGAGAANVLSNPLILVEGGAFGQSSAAGANAGGGSGGSGGGGVITETITESTPSGAAPAPQQPQQVGSGSVTRTPATNTSTGSSNLLGLPPVKHFFLIVLSDRGYKQSFGSKDPYFSKTLPKQGNLIQYYYAVAGSELANGIGLISGQGPTAQTTGNCPAFSAFAATGKGKFGQDLGTGCVYPATTPTLASQLSGSKQGGWKAYIEGMDRARRAP
jgi:hypothetical protein